MRKNLFLSCLVLFVLGTSLVVPVEADSTSWSYIYGGVRDSSTGYSVVETSDGGYAVAGSFNSEAWLMKTDAYGNMEWNKTYQGIWNDKFYSVVVASDGGYAIAGVTHFDFWLVKTDAYGNMEWNKTYGGTHPDTAHSLVATSDGGYAIAGTLTSEDVVEYDGWLVKVDAYGNMVWNKTYGRFGAEEKDYIYSVVETSDGGYAIAGRQIGDFWLVKTDAFGNMMWEKTYGGAKDDIVCSVVETSDGGYAIAGSTWSFGDASCSDFWLVKTDQYGNMEWDKLYGELSSSESAYLMIRTSDGGYAIAGTKPPVVEVGESRYCDMWLVKADAYGNMEWNRTYSGGYDDIPRSLIVVSDGGYVIAGSISDWHNPASWLLLMKTDETGYIPDFPDVPDRFIPEYHSLLLPLLLLVATLVIVIYKKRLFD